MFTFLEQRLKVVSPTRVLVFLFLSLFALTLRAQEATQVDSRGHAVPATLPHMYGYVFRFQRSMEKLGTERDSKGGSGSVFRNILQVRFHLTPDQFASFEQSAAKYAQEEQKLKTSIQAAVTADKAEHPATKALSESAKTQVHAMAAGIDKAADDEIYTLHQLLAPVAAEALDQAVLKFYSQAQKTVQSSVPAAPRESFSLDSRTSILPRAARRAASITPDCAYQCTSATGTGSIAFSLDGKTVNGYSEADISQEDSDNDCYPYVQGTIIQGSNTVATAEADSPDLEADVTTSASVDIGDSYSEGTLYEACIDDSCTDTGYVVSVSAASGVPTITSITPTSGVPGASGQLTANGTYLSGAGEEPTVSVNGSGLSLMVTQVDGTAKGEAYLDYNVATDATAGADTFTLTTVWGTSNAATFTVDCGAPSGITIQPSTWLAGKATNITISGSGFCSSSRISSVSGNVSFTSGTYVGPNTMTATVTPTATDPNETVVLTITNPSTSGLGGGSASGSASVQAVTGSLYVLDPYLSPLSGSTSLSTSTVISSLSNYSAVQAEGIIADGSATFIAVFVTDANVPVTFTSTNATTLAAYSPTFLTSAPASGSSTLTVNPILQGSYYYAFALVQAGTQAAMDIGGQTQVSAVSSGYKNAPANPAAMITLPTPIVLVHGLWGSAASLQSTQTYLNNSSVILKTYPFLVYPICYSTYLAFDATADTLPGSQSGCEFTSTQAMDNYLSKTLYPQLDGDHLVGGRVNVVAHSMGGLVARHYSATTTVHSATTTAYKAPRNRSLGTFQKIITIDTPETGSQLSYYLTTTAAKQTLKAATLTDPYILWLAVCGTSSATTLEVCFGNKHIPLAYGSTDATIQSNLSSGAVASLIPSSTHITTAPTPNIPNAKWYAIDSNFHDGDSPGSILRSFLNNLVSAGYATGTTVPTLSGILGTTNNDVIVTQTSQNYNGAATTVANFPAGGSGDLAHAPLPTIGSVAFLMGLSNANVTNSANVNAQVAYWLGFQTTTTPSVVTAPPTVAEQALVAKATQQKVSETKHFALAPERLSAVVPGEAVGLAQPLQIALNVGKGTVTGISVVQRDPVSHEAFTNEKIVGASSKVKMHDVLTGDVSDDGTSRLVREEGTTKFVEIVPLQLGKLDLEIAVQYADGGYAKQTYSLNVVPSTNGLTRFMESRGGSSVPVYLGDKPEDRQTWLSPAVSYKGLKYPIYLTDSLQIHFKVEQPTGSPVIEIDESGMIHGLHEGNATVYAEFGSATDKLDVHVYNHEP